MNLRLSRNLRSLALLYAVLLDGEASGNQEVLNVPNKLMRLQHSTAGASVVGLDEKAQGLVDAILAETTRKGQEVVS